VLRNTNFAARPLQALDNSTLLTKNIPTRRNAAAAHVKKDLNTVYDKAL
jgi:hypothetical protein